MAMPAPVKSINVCANCRARKKKCGGQRPSCSSCLSRGELCFYKGEPAGALANQQQHDWHLMPVLDASSDDVRKNLWATYRAGSTTSHEPAAGPSALTQQPPAHDVEGVWGSEASSNPPKLTPGAHAAERGTMYLPPLETILDLVELFFSRIYQFVPVLHKRTLVAGLQTQGLESVPSVLLISIIAVSSPHHPEDWVQNRQNTWYEEANAQVSTELSNPHHQLQTLQAALLVIYQAIILTDFSRPWFILGSAWRKALEIGLASMDGDRRRAIHAFNLDTGSDWIEKEQCRRVVWAFFVFDRAMCFPIGMVHTINDRRLANSLPLPEDIFQEADQPPEDEAPRYSSDIDLLISRLEESTRNNSATILQYLVGAYVLLGRVVDETFSTDYDYQNRKCETDALISHLVRFRLMLPRSATDLSAAGDHDFTSVIWLSIILNLNTIFLYYRPIGDDEYVEDSAESFVNWSHCVDAARNTVIVLRSALNTSTDFLLNEHTLSPLLICARILIVEYKCPARASIQGGNYPAGNVRDVSLKHDLELLVQVFQRQKDALQSIGTKFWNSLAYFVGQGAEEMYKIKLSGSRDLFYATIECSSSDAESIIIEP